MLLETFRLVFLFAVLLQTFEDLTAMPHFSNEKYLRFINLSKLFFVVFAMVSKFWPPLAFAFICQILIRLKFKRSFNGASDSLTVLILLGLMLASISPHLVLPAFYYITLQVVMSYFMAGLCKIKEPSWRSGYALEDFLNLKKYASSPSALALFNQYPKLFKSSAWAVMLFELSFPIAFFFPPLLKIYLIAGAIFHLVNFFIFGLNRFFWLWISTYPLLYHFSVTGF